MLSTIRDVLSSSLLFWEVAGYISTGVVIFGCVGEYIADFTRVPKSDDERHRISKLSLVILIVGIAGELLTAIRSSQISGRVIADLQATVSAAKGSALDAAQAAARANEAADGAEIKADEVGKKADEAGKKAGQAESSADGAFAKAAAVRAEAEGFEKEFNADLNVVRQYVREIPLPRSLDDRPFIASESTVRTERLDEIKKYAGTSYSIEVEPFDIEATGLAQQMTMKLLDVGWRPLPGTPSVSPWRIPPGVWVLIFEQQPHARTSIYSHPAPAPPSKTEHAATALISLLVLDLGSNGQTSLIRVLPGESVFQVYNSPPPRNDDVVILVGPKPLRYNSFTDSWWPNEFSPQSLPKAPWGDKP